jgi:hypothetical protein
VKAGIQKMPTDLKASAMVSENRIYSRVKFRWPAIIFTERKAIEGITRNISVNGAFIYYYQPHDQGIPLPLNKRVAMVINVPERLPLLIQAEVVWSDFLSSDEENTLLGVGLRFIDIFYEDRQYLREAIAEHCMGKE